ncbi:hypothetical protein [Curtobacterium aurantiacum]|uniref:Uncharacterized protein n=2 Tax=Curtobacterium aurantiacum TaxID=3236919 RepID=A0ABS5VAD4_9MICO|nr:hypothetical protein [Curtobacterium flaccumfaciens]MBT1586443.1 hypothetical protein [Curtobacterium flaccumfaciens pv. flaccumfaciens]
MMPTESYPYPAAVSQVSEGDTPAARDARAIAWLRAQKGGPVVVVTPRKDVRGVVKAFAASAGVTHLSWRGLSIGSLTRSRVLLAWPDRDLLNGLWGIQLDALAVIEHGQRDTHDWIEDAQPTRLLADGLHPTAPILADPLQALPNGIDGILEYLASQAAGYSSGLKWNEEDKLKADLMNRRSRWDGVSPDQVRAKCRALGMRPNDVDTIVVLVQRRLDGGRFNVRKSYRQFHFLPDYF